MAKALALSATSEALVNSHQLLHKIEDGLRHTLDLAFEKDNGYTLFRWEDWPAWVIFTSVFLVLIVFDNVILHRNPEALTVTRAIFYTLFWMCAAGCFCFWVACWYSTSSAYMWASGYLLEWMLSFDNLFVFHLIFSVYACPDNQKHRPLYLGIMGAVVFRLVFIFIGEYLMHAMTFMHLVFGAFLIYTGLNTVMCDEEDEDPSQNPMVLWLKNHMAFVSVYCKDASFFVQCPVNEQGETDIPEAAIVKGETPRAASETDALLEEAEENRIPVVDFSLCTGAHHYERRATMLFLVVVCLEISDILFAVDSVSAIVAQVNDLFLAYTSCVFAMLGLRATFFIIDVLVQLFALLKYGVAIVLVFVGVKLMLHDYYHIPPMIVCAILVSAIAGSMVASVIQEKYLQAHSEGKMSPKTLMSPQMAEHIAKIRNSPFGSPAMPVKEVPQKLSA